MSIQPYIVCMHMQLLIHSSAVSECEYIQFWLNSKDKIVYHIARGDTVRIFAGFSAAF